jgi:hypothetical protein
MVLQDSRIVDLRSWKPAEAGKGEPGSLVHAYRRLKVLKQAENACNNLFRIGLLQGSSRAQFRFPQQQLRPALRASHPGDPPDLNKPGRWEISVDFEKVPPGETVDITYEHLSTGEFMRFNEGSTTLPFEIDVETAELNRWMLLPEGREYRNFSLIRYQTGKPGTVENVKIVTEYLADDSRILAFKLLSLKAGYTYELTWFYK